MSENLAAAFNIMWMGMLGLFIVMILIAVGVVIMGKINNKEQ